MLYRKKNLYSDFKYPMFVPQLLKDVSEQIQLPQINTNNQNHFKNQSFKGTLSLISSDPQFKDDNARCTKVPLKML